LGRTIPSFRYALDNEASSWVEFRGNLDKSRRSKVDEAFAVARLYVSACSAALQPVVVHSVFMANIFHDYQKLADCIEQVEKITGDKFNEPIAK
jgi:hypothetical protein